VKTEKIVKREKGREEEKGAEEQRLKNGKAWSSKIRRIVKVRGVYRRLMGIMG
jgi:hypothetical protein